MSENPARSELESSVSVSGSWRSNACRRSRWRDSRLANGATDATAPAIEPDQGPAITANNKKTRIANDRHVEEQLGRADGKVGLLEHQLGRAINAGSLRNARREGDRLLHHRGLGLAHHPEPAPFADVGQLVARELALDLRLAASEQHRDRDDEQRDRAATSSAIKTRLALLPMNSLAMAMCMLRPFSQRRPTTRRANGSMVNSSGSSFTPRSARRSENSGRMPGALEAAEVAAVLVDTHSEVERVEVLHDDRVALHAEHLGHVRDAARAVTQSRERCTIRSSADAICSRIARIGSSMPPISTMVSMRDSVSRGLFEWIVVSEPSWPVFIAWSMSSASAPRASPTMMRSGRIRSELRTSSRILTSPAAFDVRRPRLERADVRLPEPELLGVLDGDDALVVRE